MKFVISSVEQWVQYDRISYEELRDLAKREERNEKEFRRTYRQHLWNLKTDENSF